jgi:hypothetical protein
LFHFQTIPALTKCIHKAFSVGNEGMAAKTASNGAASAASGAISEKPVAQFQLQPSEAGSRPPLSDQVLFLLIYRQIV